MRDLELYSDFVRSPSGNLYARTQSRTNRVLTIMTGVLAKMSVISFYERLRFRLIVDFSGFALLLCTNEVNLGPKKFYEIGGGRFGDYLPRFSMCSRKEER